MPTKSIDLPTRIEKFSDESACHTYLERLRWPEAVTCPGRERKDRTREDCGSERVVRLEKRRLFECMECGYQFSTRAGTIFHDSKLPLWKWFLAVYMMVQSKKGISANQLKRMLGVSYKTAWYLCHRIRKAMSDDDAKPLTGTVETDETFVGGNVRALDEDDVLENESIVMGAVSRGGQVRLQRIEKRTGREIDGFVGANVSPKAKAFYTDELSIYEGVARRLNLPHGSVNHSREEWVHGKIHTNTIEGVFSLLDRSIMGAYHKVSKKHLPAYLQEVEWKYNNRNNPYLFRDTIVELIRADRMEYKQLTTRDEARAS